MTSQNPYALPTTKYPIGPTNTSPYGNLGALSPSATAYQPPVNTSQNPYVLVARQPSASPPNQYGPAVITTVGPSNPYKIDPAGVNYLGRQKRNDKSNRSNDKAKFADTMDLTSEEMLVFNTDDNVPDGNCKLFIR